MEHHNIDKFHVKNAALSLVELSTDEPIKDLSTPL